FKRMKILYIINQFPKLSETFILNEILQLRKFNHNVIIAALSDPGEPKVHEDYQVIFQDTHFLKNGLKLLTKFDDKSYAQCVQEIVKIINNEKIDHIHCHFAKKNVELAYIINKMLKIPYTFTTHAYDIFYDIDKDIEKWANSAKKVITISNYNKDYMIKNFKINPNNIEVIHCGIELDKFRQIEVKKEDQFTILNVGRLNPIKGQKYLIEACRILKDKRIDFQCWIIGGGKERENLEKQIAHLDLGNNINLLGPKKNEELIEYYNKADVFVLPSISESMGVVNMEALACGTPVIASDVRGVPELIKDNYNGILIEPENPEEIAKGIMKLKNDPNLLDKFKNNSRGIVNEEFNIKKNVMKILEVFS
ncbi:MAG: glycosyltransferase family 4 protein, partial [Candidatus Margulisbacteria bacterium]|nr:glycosyltransferase family 4 protein [Candidatus Margulisiibacteriota bacterium]